MITTLTVFVGLYLVIFVVFASKYSSTMQEINKDLRILKLKGINTEKVQSRISVRERKVSKLKKFVWLPTIAVFIAHLITISISEKVVNMDYLVALILLASISILIVIISWMKGAGTIDGNPRLPGFTRI